MKHGSAPRWRGGANAAALVALLGFLGPLLASGGSGGEPRDSSTEWLRPAPGPARPAPTTDRLARRRRAVELDRGALRRAARHPGARLRFDLFEDLRLTGAIERVERRDDGGLSIFGRIEGDAGDFLLVVEAAQVSGSIRTAAGRVYDIGSDASGRPVVQEIDLDRFPECSGAAAPDVPAAAPPHPPGESSGPIPLAGDPDPRDLIDVLVAYTERAEIAAGGPAAARALAQRAVDEANLVYANSGIDTRLRLVWRGRTLYDETQDSHLIHLQRLASSNDGYMDEIHAIRNATGADVVSLFVDDPESAGIGYLMQQPTIGFAPLAFSVVYFFAASNNLSLPHEIGHSQGCEHDRANATANPAFHDAYGFRFTGNDNRPYRTVMGYPPGQRIPHFSNPDIFYKGQPTGRANKENNAAAINATAEIVANFRPRRHHPGSVRDFDGNGADDLATYDALDGTWWIGLARDGVFDTIAWGSLLPPGSWGPRLEGDFDGDGWMDLASFYAPNAEWWVSLSRGDRFETLLWSRLSPAAGWSRQKVGDFDGDGRDDIANFRDPSGEWWVGLSSGTGFSTTLWGSLVSPQDWTDAVVGDFDGDGRDDLANYRAADGEWWVGVSSGAGFSLSFWDRQGAASGWTGAVAGDFSGDGRDDLVRYQPSDGGVWVAASTGSAFETRSWGVIPGAGDRDPLLSGDFDGDGFYDLASFGALAAEWSVSLSTGATFSTTAWSMLQTIPGWTRHVAGDFNGDGRMDVADYLEPRGEWWVGLSTGTQFDVGLWARFVLPRSDVDTDGDGVVDADDCGPTDGDAWAIPGEIEDLFLEQPGGAAGATRLSWSEPVSKGGTGVTYDVLSSNSPYYFGWGSVACVETNDASDREALDASPPAPILYYLVRAGNACGEGGLGLDSQGAPRTGVSCP